MSRPQIYLLYIVESEPDWYVKQVTEDFVVRTEWFRLKITHEARLHGTDARLLVPDAPNSPDPVFSQLRNP
jgi:hypothetical protein